MTKTLKHQFIASNDIDLHVVSKGSGPLVIMCHGFPGLWYSWRNQMQALADAGYTAVAFDQRGYGRSSRPIDPAVYDSEHVVNDLIHLLDALGEQEAVFIGHDFGAAQVYNLAVRHPERVKAVIGVACPYDFDLAGRGCSGSNPPADAVYNRAFARPDKKPSVCFAEVASQHFYHMHYYQTIGPAEKELGAQPELFLKRLFWALSAEGNLLDWSQFPTAGNGYLDVLADPAIELPWHWMSQTDMDYFVTEFSNSDAGTEFIGGINSYRVADRNWELGQQYADSNIVQPSLFIAGSEDPVLQMIGPEAMQAFKQCSLDLRGIDIIANAGHFVQQEQPTAFNQSLLKFLASLLPH